MGSGDVVRLEVRVDSVISMYKGSLRLDKGGSSGYRKMRMFRKNI